MLRKYLDSRHIKFVGLVVTLVIVGLLWVNSRRAIAQKAHEFYLSGDCENAMLQYDKVFSYHSLTRPWLQFIAYISIGQRPSGSEEPTNRPFPFWKRQPLITPLSKPKLEDDCSRPTWPGERQFNRPDILMQLFQSTMNYKVGILSFRPKPSPQ